MSMYVVVFVDIATTGVGNQLEAYFLDQCTFIPCDHGFALSLVKAY